MRESVGAIRREPHGRVHDPRRSGAVDFVNYVTTNDVAALAVGQAQYSTILNERGTIVDDCLVYRFADHLMMVVNASNKDKDLAHIAADMDRFDCTHRGRERTHRTARAAGPNARRRCSARHTEVATSMTSRTTTSSRATVAGVPDVIISRTGYTGEDGFELYFDAIACGRDLERAHRGRDSGPRRTRLRGTRCASRWGWRSTATTSTTRRRRYEANLALAREDEEG